MDEEQVMVPDYKRRLERLRRRIEAAKIDALMVSEPNNIFYLSGSSGGYTGARVRLLIDSSESILVIDRRYYEETIRSAFADKIIPWTKSSFEELVGLVKGAAYQSLGFEASHITVKQFERLKREFEGIKLVGTSGLVEPLREVKDAYEIQKITKAAEIGDAAFQYILDFIKPGVTEIDISIELDYFMRKNGSEKSSFETIVASGVNSAVPHATPSGKKIEVGDFVKMDFGAVVGGYHSDMTRTVVVGKASKKQKQIYSLVKEAQETALSKVAPKVECQELDSIARELVGKKGYGEAFVHNLGHGVGLEVHEAPVLGKGSKDVLKSNMVITIEPGIYISNLGGVRIEDLVLVTKAGYKVLTHSTKELVVL
ncbi:MAG: Xaa-Pro peptidase family protein [Actinomycetota bacterium]|nr:Xaa-Pro peptidase family protein [Actinomycetota bacterium]